MAILPLLSYFALENFLVWKVFKVDKKKLTIRAQERDQYQKLLKFYSCLLIVVALLRDLIIVDSTHRAPLDLIYSPATQKILSYLSIITLLVSIFSRFFSYKTIPILETFYPIYLENDNHTWNRDFWHPVYYGTWALYITAFLWQPSTTAIVPPLLYPACLWASFYLQERISQAPSSQQRQKSV
jgi:hypothetical protein